MAARMRERRGGPSSRLDSHGSRTMTIDETPAGHGGDGAGGDGSDQGLGEERRDRVVGRLILRAGPSSTDNAAPARTERRVVWSEGTIDNEGMGKKKSKICCIYHKPRAFDESSSEEDSSDSDESSDDTSEFDSDASSSSSSSEYTGARLSKASRAGKKPGQDDDDEDDAACNCDHDHTNKSNKGKHKNKSHSRKTKARRSAGSRTMTVTQEAGVEDKQDDSGPPPQDEDDAAHKAEPSRRKPNKYEEGIA